MLLDCHFEIEYFNARGRIEERKKWRWPGIIADGERFYIARKK
jgi:hypothetical protein